MLVITDEMIGDAFAAINKRLCQIYGSPTYDENAENREVNELEYDLVELTDAHHAYDTGRLDKVLTKYIGRQWNVWNMAFPDMVYHVRAFSFDKAIRQCRKIDPDCNAAQPE